MDELGLLPSSLAVTPAFAHSGMSELWLDGVVGPLRTDAFVFSGELPRGANPDVAMFVTDRRPIPVGAAALAETQRSGSLVDVPGGYMIVHDFAGKGVVCGQTWAAMCLVVDHEGSVSMRGFKGSVFNKLSSAVRSELVVSGGQPGSQWRPSEVRMAAMAAYAPEVRQDSTAEAQVALEKWALEGLKALVDRLVLPVVQGGGGFSREAVKMDGRFPRDETTPRRRWLDAAFRSGGAAAVGPSLPVSRVSSAAQGTQPLLAQCLASAFDVATGGNKWGVKLVSVCFG